MKTQVKIITISFLLMAGLWVTPKKASAQGAVSFQVFYDELSPYGAWVDNPYYGYVWVPNEGPGFTPYATNGYWINTDDGWTWVSNYSWGWAPFHYGRWYTDAYYGPVWIPGNEWGPGWVSWRHSNDYYGWTPIGPGISISVAYSNSYNVPSNQWTFVRGRDFGRHNINNYYVDHSNNVTIINNTTVINNIHVDKTHNVRYNAGPERKEVEKQAGQTFRPAAIKEVSKPGQNIKNNELHIYKPQLQKFNAAGQKPAPSKVESLKNIKPPAQRISGTQPLKDNKTDKNPVIQPKSNEKPGIQKQVQPNQKQVQPKQINQPKKVEGVKQPQQVKQPQKQTPPQQQVKQPQKQTPQPQQVKQPQKQTPPQKQVRQPQKQQAPPPQQVREPQKQAPQQQQQKQQSPPPQQVREPQKQAPQQQQPQPNNSPQRQK